MFFSFNLLSHGYYSFKNYAFAQTIFVFVAKVKPCYEGILHNKANNNFILK